MEFILFGLGVALGWYLGSKFTTAIHLISFEKVLNDMDVSKEQLDRLAKANGLDFKAAEEEATAIHITIESHATEIYAYRVDTGEFLGQGPDGTALIERLVEQFKNTMGDVRLVVDQGAELLQKRNG